MPRSSSSIDVAEEDMRRSSLIVAAIVLVSTLFVGLTLLPDVRATTLYVGGAGLGNYTTIEGAMADANAGDTIFVYSGTYNERLAIYRSLSLLGEDRDSTIINGSGAGDVVRITADWVNLTGFTVTNSGRGFHDSAIKLDLVSNCNITGNNVSWNNYHGISVWSGSNNVIADNTAMQNLVGLSLWGEGFNIFANNNASSNKWYGISFHYSDGGVIADNIANGNNWSGILISSTENVKVIGNNASLNGIGVPTHGLGVHMTHSNNITVVDNSAINNHHVGIYLEQSHDNTIRDNIAHQTIFNGMTIISSVNNTIANNTLTENRRGLYILWPSAENNTIAHNNISRNVREGILVWESNNNTFRSNDLSGNGEYGIFLHNSHSNQFAENNVSLTQGTITDGFGIGLNGSNDNAFVRNELWYNQYGAFSLWTSHGNMIVDNNMSRNHFGIDVWLSSSNTIKGNRISQNNATAVWLTYSENSRIIDNHLVGNSNGIMLNQSESNTVSGNNVSWNNWSGIFVDGVPSGNVISDNTFSHNQEGIVFRYQVSNTVSNNTISWNSRNGIYLYASWGSIIGENKVMQNGVGINLTFSSNNTIFHNSIVNNGEQAHDDRDTNQWDDGYPSGGNYWSDYAGIDICSGPNQNNCPDPDAIGDTPYVIDADSQDRYPLMWPFEMMFPQPPVLLDAMLTGSNLENVTLMWLLSPDDGNVQRPVVEYSIFRGMDYNQGGLGYNLIASIPNGTSAFVDSFAGEGDSNSYFYRICARNTYNWTSCTKNQAGKFAHPASWPLISIPLIQSNESIEHVLQTVEYDKAWYYDSLDQEWRWHMPFKCYRRGLWTINNTMGLWVNYTAGSYVTVAGIVPTQTSIQLYKGWNLVSFPSFDTSYTVGDLKADTGATRVEGFVETMPPWPPSLLWVLGNGEVLIAGIGYWVKVEADTVWIVEAS